MEFELIHGKVVGKNNLYIGDESIPQLFLIKFLIIIVGLSTIINAYNAARSNEPLLLLLLLVIFFIDVVASFYIFNRSTTNNVDFKDIKSVNIKNYFNIKNIVVLKLKNGKNRYIGNFKNSEDSKNLVQYIYSKINLNS